MSAITLEVDLEEPISMQDELLQLRAWEESKAREALLANVAHLQAQARLNEAVRSMTLSFCEDDEL
jgi:hypothetical protein